MEKLEKLEKIKKIKKKNFAVYSFLSIFLFLFVWWLATEGLGILKPTAMSGPIQTFETLIRKFWEKNPDGFTMQEHIFASLEVTMIGYFVGIAIGTVLGILMGWYEKVDIFVRPLFDLIKPIPGIAWVPVFIVLFGIGLLPKVVTIMISALIPTIVNSYSGVCQTKEVHIWVAQTFGASKGQILLKVAIPSSIPYIMTGVRVALGASWATIVGAEMLAAEKGLGYLINMCRGIYRPDIILAGMICVGVIGALFALILSFVENQLMKGGRW